ncbi:non-specific serine/threonine protein kinase [Malassezia yamatoensis]|uniref:Non-specific serine/threonine protein kinase n=1 Tax=Malassezia yamatoensis TaxID=253288 RepID=A0AAJ6CID4_9BASI|nr:non-specific serine/threonine protein kinase [Malassezia yamatoensis]
MSEIQAEFANGQDNERGHGCFDDVLETKQLQLRTHEPTGRRMVNNYIMYVNSACTDTSGDEIGHGVHGRVRLARNADTGERVAMKIVPREVRRKLGEKLDPDPSRANSLESHRVTDQKVLREIAILKKCKHPNIVQLKEVIDDPQSRKIFMVLEYMDHGEIYWHDSENRPMLTVEQTREIIRDVVLGLEYLHHQGVVHRDIKPANLLWDKSYHVKISDFGVSHVGFMAAEEDHVALAKTAGSPAFFAPELCLSGHGKEPWPVTKAIDVWALGVTLYCLLFGSLPFKAETEYSLFSVIAYEDYSLPATMGADHIPIGPRPARWGSSARHSSAKLPDNPQAELVRDILDGLLKKDPSQRMTLQQLKHHAWITGDLHDADHWLKETNPALQPSLDVSHKELNHALTGLPRLRQRMKILQQRLAVPLATLSPRLEPVTDEVNRSSPSRSSSAHSLSRFSSRIPRKSSTMDRIAPSTIWKRPPMPLRSKSQVETHTHPSSLTAPATPASTSATPEPMTWTGDSMPSMITMLPALERIQQNQDHDSGRSWSEEDDLDEDLETHSSSSADSRKV